MAEKVYQTETDYIKVRCFEDGSIEEIPITESEYLEEVQKQPSREHKRQEESDKFTYPIGFHDDGRKITEEEIQKVREWLYPTS